MEFVGKEAKNENQQQTEDYVNLKPQERKWIIIIGCIDQVKPLAKMLIESQINKMQSPKVIK